MPAQKEEGRQKSDRHGMGASPSGGGGGSDTVFNHRVDLKLRIMERLRDMTGEARSDNLHIPLEANGREIFLRFLSKGDCIRFCTRSQAPAQGHNKDEVIRYIRISREVMDLSRKQKFNGGGHRGYHRGHWDRSGGNAPRNSEGQNHGNGAGIWWRTRWSL